MKRLLKISLDFALLSFIPVLSWFCLSLILDKNLINIFTLTYPIQFIYYIIKSIFSTGANISKEKDKNKDVVMSGLLIGTISSFIIYGIILFNIDSYINYMNMDIKTYKIFAIYSIIQLFVQQIFNFIIEKLYYEDKNVLANKYSITFNLINFLVLIISSLITKNKIIIITITLISIFIYVLYILKNNLNKFKLNINIFKCIKYDSVNLFNGIAFFLIYLLGLSNALEYGESYALALTFVALITDTQWDTFEAIKTTAQIDISRNEFNYKEHRKNAYKLLAILFLSTTIMFLALYSFYNLNFKLTIIYLLFDIINFVLFPIYTIKTCYLQLEWSPFITTSNKIISSVLRVSASLLKNPFCTGIGQIVSSLYQFITINILFKKNYNINKKVLKN